MGFTLQNREKTVAVRENTGTEKPSHRKGEGEAEGVLKRAQNGAREVSAKTLGNKEWTGKAVDKRITDEDVTVGGRKRTVSGPELFGLELPLTGRVNDGEGAVVGAVEAVKDLFASGYIEERGLGGWAPEHRFLCEIYRQK